MSEEITEYTLPLSVKAFSKIQASGKEFNAQINTVINEALNTLRDGAVATESLRSSTTDNDQSEPQVQHINALIDKTIQEMDTLYRETMDLRTNRSCTSRAVEQVVRRTQPQAQSLLEEMTSVNYESCKMKNVALSIIAERNALYEAEQALPESRKYGNARAYVSFRQDIWNVNNKGEDMPNINKLFSDYVEDDDVIEEHTRESFKCPLTKRFYENPVTSTVCNHSFSKDAILHIFKNQRSNRIKCPIPACSHFFGPSQLRDNPELAERAKYNQEREIRETQARSAHLDRI